MYMDAYGFGNVYAVICCIGRYSSEVCSLFHFVIVLTVLPLWLGSIEGWGGGEEEN